MSHIVCVEGVEVNDLAALRRMCKQRGWVFHEGQKRYMWYGEWVDDSPVPRALFETQAEYDRVVAMSKSGRIAYMNALLGRGEHAISIPGCSDAEIGLVKVGKGLVFVWDWVSNLTSTLGNPSSKDWVDPLGQYYTTAKIECEALSQGFNFETTWDEETGKARVEVFV